MLNGGEQETYASIVDLLVLVIKIIFTQSNRHQVIALAQLHSKLAVIVREEMYNFIHAYSPYTTYTRYYEKLRK